MLGEIPPVVLIEAAGRSRCFAFWQEFSKACSILFYISAYFSEFYSYIPCETQCYAETDNPKECSPQAEDYLECLHHTKEVCWIRSSLTFSLELSVEYRLRARKPSRRSLSGRCNTKLQKAERLRTYWRMAS